MTIPFLSKIVQNAQDKENLKFANFQANLKKINAGKAIKNRKINTSQEAINNKTNAKEAILTAYLKNKYD